MTEFQTAFSCGWFLISGETLSVTLHDVRTASEAVSEVSQDLVYPRHGPEEDEERASQTDSAEVNLLP